MNNLIVLAWYNPLFLWAEKKYNIKPPEFVISALNKTRHGKHSGCWYNSKFGPIMMRDPYAHPMKTHFAYSQYHLFAIRKKNKH